MSLYTLVSILYEIVTFLTIATTIIAQRKSATNKKHEGIGNITNILQLDICFDIINLFFLKIIYFKNALANTSYLFDIFYFPNIIFIHIYKKIKFPIIPIALLVTIPVIVFFMGKTLIDSNYEHTFFPILALRFFAMIVCVKRALRIKTKVRPINYFYYLLTGFIVLEFFYFFRASGVIDFNMDFWMKFLYFFLFYQIFFRLTYIIYVFKSI